VRISFLSSPFVFDDDDEDEDEDMVVILARALLLFLANICKTRASELMTVDDAVVVAELIFIPRVFLFFLLLLKCVGNSKQEEKCCFGYTSRQADKWLRRHILYFFVPPCSFVTRRIHIKNGCQLVARHFPSLERSENGQRSFVVFIIEQKKRSDDESRNNRMGEWIRQE